MRLSGTIAINASPSGRGTERTKDSGSPHLLHHRSMLPPENLIDVASEYLDAATPLSDRKSATDLDRSDGLDAVEVRNRFRQ